MFIQLATCWLLIQLSISKSQIIKDYKTLGDSYPVHKHLNEDDLWRHFDTRDPNEVDGYHIVRVLENHRPDSVDAEHSADRILTIETTSKVKSVKYILSLKRNKFLIHQNLKDHRKLENCLYFGSVVYPGEGGTTALSSCHNDGYSGSIQHNGEKYKLIALPSYLISNNSRIHLLKKVAASQQNDHLDPAMRILRTKRQISVNPLYMELNVAVDDAFEAGQPLQTRIATAFGYLNQLQSIFLDPSFGRRMFIIVKNFEISPLNFNGITNIVTYLNMFCNQQRTIPNIDTSVLLTGKNLQVNGNSGVAGIAWLRSTCVSNARRCGIVEARGSRIAETIAHEIGHNLGMDHDCLSCGRNCNILGLMGPTLNGVTRFSTCSRAQFETFLRSNSRSCLTNFPTDQRLDSRLLTAIEGRFALNTLCDYYFPGSSATVTSTAPFNNPCSELHCNLRGTDNTANAPAFQGMRCDVTGTTVFVCNANRQCVDSGSVATTPAATTPAPTTRAPRRRGWWWRRRRRSVFGRKKRAADEESQCTEKYWECNCKDDGSVMKVSCIKACGGCIEIFRDKMCEDPKPEKDSEYCQKQCSANSK